MDLIKRKELIVSETVSRFGTGAGILFFRSPGRVDIMGSHTDYNLGLVLASTVTRDIIAGARPRSDGAVNLYSVNTGLQVSACLETLKPETEHGWANYPKGVIYELQSIGVKIDGIDIVFHGNIPEGANLSSSAALEASTCEAVLGISGVQLPLWDKIHLCRRAENEFVGVPCGIMDQFTVFTGASQSALLLDCKTLAFEEIPFSIPGHTLAVIDSGTGREIVKGNYARRVNECSKALKILKQINPVIQSLTDASDDDLGRAFPDPDNLLYRRARHVMDENERVRGAAQALKSANASRLGRIMNESYESCRDLYENSSPELDELHEILTSQAGGVGARICGAGWGGCLLALVQEDEFDSLEDALARNYSAPAGFKTRPWKVRPSGGAGPF